MFAIESRFDPDSAIAGQNAAGNRLLLDRLNALQAQVRHPAPKSGAPGQLCVRDRIASLIDPGTSLFELSPLAAYQVYQTELPAAGIVTGIGTVAGRDVMIMANDASVKGGSYFPLTVKKQLRAQEIALENALPCVYLLDSGGIYLPLQAESCLDRDHIGRLSWMQARMSALKIPQLAVVMGFCTAASAYLAVMCDEVIMVRDHGGICVSGPLLVEAATGEITSKEELSGADLHGRVSGVADYLAADDEAALETARDLISRFNRPRSDRQQALIEPPLYPASELYALISADQRHPFSAKEVLARLLDGSLMHEFKATYGQNLICGFGKIQGYLAGFIANDGPLDGDSSLKGAHFVALCQQRQLPLVFLQNVTGFSVGKEHERQGIAKHGAKFIHAVATTTVPKITLMMGNAFGAANFAMACRSFDPRFLWSWPNARMGVMGGEQAAELMIRVK
ncbi:MAG TPA: carboxyl transferase domain-containing protein [Candidatus Obscuribacterales bacterium]